MLIRQKGLSLPRNLTVRDFWKISNSVLNKGKSVIPPLFNGPNLLSCASDKPKLFAKIFCKNSDIDDTGVSTRFPI